MGLRQGKWGYATQLCLPSCGQMQVGLRRGKWGHATQLWAEGKWGYATQLWT